LYHGGQTPIELNIINGFSLNFSSFIVRLGLVSSAYPQRVRRAVFESDQKRPKLSIIGGAAGGWAPPHVLVPLQHRCPKTARRSNESRCQLPTVEGRRDTQKGDCRPLVLACCCLLGVLN